jgi:ParB family chromosome partitioning protein
MGEEKFFEIKVVLKQDKLRKYFPQSYSSQPMEEVVIKLLEAWHHKRRQEQSR